LSWSGPVCSVIGVNVTPVWRPTARIVVLDSDGRVLLFSSADQAGETWWFTPGGGVHRGETLTAAAVRELAEEIGYACAEADLGPVVATSAGVWPEPADDGRRYFGADSFFFVRVPDPTVNTDGQEELERSLITGHRWWTVDELRQAAGHIFPVGLGDLVARVLTEGVPPRPVRLPWT
jgi:8-oxo-dGTP pyrophosphatase MutT (NUDIX family)